MKRILGLSVLCFVLGLVAGCAPTDNGSTDTPDNSTTQIHTSVESVESIG